VGHFTDYYPAVDSSVSFRYGRSTTVPGKGGRPRKWRSDADRVRAHRARQRGEDEPPTVERALVDGDEAAAAWERIRQLGVTIEEQRSELKSLKAALRRSAKSLDQERARFTWIESDNDRLRNELAEAKSECVHLREQLDELRSPMPPQPAQRAGDVRPNRAQRRAADRRRRGKD
jgi:predicted RNase H-like nuclease (RuvC/YqgF family)